MSIENEKFNDNDEGCPLNDDSLTGLTGSTVAASQEAPFNSECSIPSTGDNKTTANQPKEKTAFELMKESKKADLLALKLRKQIAWDDTSSEWFKFIDGYWQQVTNKIALRTIKRHLDKEMTGGYSLQILRNMAAFLQITLVASKWNRNRDLLPMKNGVLNIATMAFSENRDPENRFNWCLPYEYHPEARCQTVMQWIKDTTSNDEEVIEILRAALYFSIAGVGDIQKFMELIGAGGTRKSTFVRLLESFVGTGNHVTTDLKNLESNRFETAVLYNKKVAIINDSSRYGGEVSTLKAATGGDPLRMEKKNTQQGQSFVAECFIIIASNEAIQSTDYTSGLSRRRIPVTFYKQVTDEDKQKWRDQGGIETVMKTEMSGVLNWVLDMGRNKATAAFGGINTGMNKAQRLHLIETNKLAAWLDDNCVLDKNAQTYTGKVPGKKDDTDKIDQNAKTKLFSNYYQWCEDTGVNNLSVQRFGNALNDLLVSILKLPVKHLPRDEIGRSFEGLTIRNNNHIKVLTPVTQEYLNVDECIRHVEGSTSETRATVNTVNHVNKNLSEGKTGNEYLL